MRVRTGMFKTPAHFTLITVQQLTPTPQLPKLFKIIPFIKMQKIVLCAFALVALAAAVPQEQEPAYILKQESNVNPDGYNFEFETSDGISRQEQGTLKQISEDQQALEVQGTYKYTAPDGVTYVVTFVANEHGYQPQEHIEQPGQ
ncbi:endocuticle structural protein SgAbd-6-like [Maniola hyperantus]|uniref:endocuticle structural protein SgAbd-6-like n=1 Tax=Aphantopus hyperantus TaxID=2795564 RepID=UPI001567E411|nr:endocuticle structural protein SgAbd-6-like [Maniola hyperantus]